MQAEHWLEDAKREFRRMKRQAEKALAPEDVERTVLIRGEPHTVVQAVNRQLTHYAGHVGQIVFLAKHLAGPRWNMLSVPRGQSVAFNAGMAENAKQRAAAPGPLDHQQDK